MQIYLVGGAVRDKLLSIPVHDKDFVVIGATPEEMLAQGYKKVGKTFPVFLHPETKEEYALARKEIKTGVGHQDFKFIFTPDITLEEDSLRRDFTCNALYQDLITGEIIDFHNGQADIKKKVLRHVSEHFSEDPLRVLRMCRFAAQLDFTVAPETMELCKKMVKDGALEHLSKDRIWQEFVKALSSVTFYRFIENARECGALKVILPEVEQLFAVPERLDFHPEGNSGAHTLLTIKSAATDDSMVNYAALLHDIGKIKTDAKCWPSHHGHDKLGTEVIKNISKKLNVPNAYTEFAIFTAENHMLYHQKIENIKKEMAAVAVYLSKYRYKNWCERFLCVLNADMCGRAKEVSLKEQDAFANFKAYLQQLENAAFKKKTSELPEFEEIIAGIKNGTIPPVRLNEAYVAAILKENPYSPE